jgi:diaminopimelate epimerase
MDYRNSDGSLSEMCGNGIRVFALYLATHSTIDPREPLKVATRAGIRTVTFAVSDEVEGGIAITVDMGTPTFGPESKVGVGERTWPSVNIGMGNPHAVVFVDELEQAGDLLTAPTHDEQVYPHGVNVEFVSRVGERHVAMRVHERGSGETRSCGTGACAVMVATALVDGAERGTPYRVDVPGGTLFIEWIEDDRILMTGPARIVAEGTTTL